MEKRCIVYVDVLNLLCCVAMSTFNGHLYAYLDFVQKFILKWAVFQDLATLVPLLL